MGHEGYTEFGFSAALTRQDNANDDNYFKQKSGKRSIVQQF